MRQAIAWSIDRLSPAARTALAFASRLMPDEIPLDWLQSPTAARLPDALEEHDGLPSPWAEVWAELHGLRLLHPADGEDDEGDGRTLPRMVRIHRMVALLVDWQQRGGTLDPQMAGLLGQLTGSAA